MDIVTPNVLLGVLDTTLNKIMRNERRERADKILSDIHDYLTECDWLVCNETLFRIDPITGTRYPGDTAFMIQIGRDLNK